MWDPRIRKGILNTKDQMVRCVQEDSWRTMDTRGMNPVAMEKHPKEMPTGTGTSASPGLASLASSS
jgi:hypothetical protein